MSKWERKYGKYAIPNLPFIMIGLYVMGYVLSLFPGNLLSYLRLEPALILQGQIWRLFTWLIIPPDSLNLFTIIMLLFYLSIGRALESTWGTFLYNLYILGGIVFSVIGAFILYGIYRLSGVPDVMASYIGYFFSTYYINLSIFLAFALSYPDMEVYLYFIIRVKMKWLGLLDLVLIGYNFVMSGWAGRVAILASLLNFIIFFFWTKGLKGRTPSQIRRRHAFEQSIRKGEEKYGGYAASSRPVYGGAGGKKARHKCCVCGQTELDNPSLEFRYCSKCEGNYEYCNEHLFTHTHIRRPPQS